jgi:nucleoside-diphosphate-sugar epimerase
VIGVPCGPPQRKGRLAGASSIHTERNGVFLEHTVATELETNYIAIDDVAAFAVRILARREVVTEAVDVGGPSNISQNDLVALIERRLGRQAKRRHVPLAALRLLPPIVRPFNELAARLMSLGFYAATRAAPFPGWRTSAERFGVHPRTVETYLERKSFPS